MAPNLSKYLTKKYIYIAGTAALGLWIISLKKNANKKKLERIFSPKNVEDVKYMITEKKVAKDKPHINMRFFRQLLQILKIAFPGWISSETFYMVLIATSLVCRSLCDLYTIYHFARIENALVGLDKQGFMQQLLQFMVVMPFIATVNNLLRYSTGELRLHLRTNLTRYFYDEYLKKFTYYRMTNLDNRISNVDQLLTTDIDKFCESFTECYCNIIKPILDIGIYVYRLNIVLGFKAPSLTLCYVLISGFFLTYLRKPTGSLTVTEQKLEGEFRHINSRLITHSEEIAFYHGNLKEKNTLMSSFNKLITHIRKFLQFRVLIGVIDNIVAKYFALFVGYLTMAIAFFSDREIVNVGIKERSLLYYENGTMMVRLGMAIGRLMLAGRELTRLAGFTVRVTQLQNVLADLNEGKYTRTMITGIEENLNTNGGKIIFRDHLIKFNNVSIITPNGDVLIKELSMEIRSGMNVLVCGPNGSGKSSLFRILGQLWPMFEGELTKPPSGKLFYIPQRPYMTLGSLRDQVTYPHSGAQAIRRGCTDAQLQQHLKRVELEYLLEREGAFDAVADWLEVLSGGEKQRIAMARLFYHAPQFAILDECTSAVSLDVEERLYNYCREVGITLLTVTHRKSLWQHHEFVLYLDGHGNYSFKPIEEGMEQFGS